MSRYTVLMLGMALGILSPGWVAPVSAAKPPLAAFDFTQPTVGQQWQPQNHISAFRHTPEGLEVTLAGDDPYFAGPARDYPANTPLGLHLRLKSEQGGGAQLFYFRDGPAEPHSVRFQVFPGDWQDVRVRLPALGPGYRFRLDPPGNRGRFVLASLRVTAATSLEPPAWPKPEKPVLDRQSAVLHAGALSLVHGRDFGEFELRVQDQRMATGHSRPLLGYLRGEEARWVSLNTQAGRQTRLNRQGKQIELAADFTDDDGGHWQITQRFQPAQTPDAVEVETRVQVDQDRSVIFLPLLTVLPGAGTFGTNKHQGLFAGLEYLANEPSSSEADLRGPAAQRRVPDTLKITFPLMAIQAGDRYVGLIWEMQPQVCALFDSPDRTLGSDAHAMAILFPGSTGSDREDGRLLPPDGARLAANQALVLRATLIGGAGRSVVPAVQKYVQLRGWPPLPTSMAFGEYVALTAAGWLDSKAREGSRYRHAVWQGFGPQAAADPAFYMDWLAERTGDAALAKRLAAAARDALQQVRPEQYHSALVSHVKLPAAPLVYGHVAENAQHARAVAASLLLRFEPDGRVLYRKSPNRPDYGQTHFAPDANGLTAQVVETLLQAAVFAGDRALTEGALEKLRALDKFRDDVPRGAQTWEIPLHTPDILACAHLVRAYTLGYELTGDPGLLDQARYWAWTGLPFVYLIDPTDQPIGRFTTPPVYGATSWVAPVWMGLPVQWCGLVYADALYRLVRHDPAGPWKRLADGITVAGIQITWPSSDPARQGLLPDVFHLRAQHRDGPAINPGTVQACAARWFGQGPLYDFHVVREYGWQIHAPGEISNVTLTPTGARFSVAGWTRQPYYVLVNGGPKVPTAKINGQPSGPTVPTDYAEGRLVLQLQGRATVELTLP